MKGDQQKNPPSSPLESEIVRDNLYNMPSNFQPSQQMLDEVGLYFNGDLDSYPTRHQKRNRFTMMKLWYNISPWFWMSFGPCVILAFIADIFFPNIYWLFVLSATLTITVTIGVIYNLLKN